NNGLAVAVVPACGAMTRSSRPVTLRWKPSSATLTLACLPSLNRRVRQFSSSACADMAASVMTSAAANRRGSGIAALENVRIYQGLSRQLQCAPFDAAIERAWTADLLQHRCRGRQRP